MGGAVILAASVIAPVVIAQQPPSAPALAAAGEGLFKSRCASCHEPPVDRAAHRTRLAQLGVLEIFNELKNGSMRPMAQGLSDQELGAITVYPSPPSEARPPAPAQVEPGYAAFFGDLTNAGVALDAEDEVIWKRRPAWSSGRRIPPPPRPRPHKNSAGTEMLGPAGAAVWSAPTIDAKHSLIFVTTGDSYTDVSLAWYEAGDAG